MTRSKFETCGTAKVELATFSHEGRDFTAVGSVVDPGAGFLQGYVSSDGRTLMRWDGSVICPLKEVSRFRIPCPNWPKGTEIRAYRAVVDGRTYSGRGSGPGMLLRLRSRRRP